MDAPREASLAESAKINEVFSRMTSNWNEFVWIESAMQAPDEYR
jgi:hypothetical protein